MKRRVLLASAVAAAFLVPATAQGAASSEAPAIPSPNSGAVRTWNQHAIEALLNPADASIPGAAQAATVGSLHLAMVHGAVYDAVNAIDGGHQPYLAGLPVASPDASMDAAVATAAHDVLDGLGIGQVPPLPPVVRDRLDALYAGALAGIPDGSAKDDGIAAGAAAASAMLETRSNDGRYEPFSFTVGTQPGQWRPTPPAFVNDPFAWVANVDPFVLDSASQFRTTGPLAPDSKAYARDYDEVKLLGAADGPRSPQQQAVADFYTVNPVPLFNHTLRAISATEQLTLVDDARLFAMVNIASADALIACWNDKAFWGFWRPLTAIHNGDDDTNRRTVGDPVWQPMIGTPPYPDHPSGYNCTTAASMHAAKAFFGRNRMEFNVVKVAPPAVDVTRTYQRFTDVIDDTIDARVYQGIHFRTADVQGARIGRNVARWLDTHHFQHRRGTP